jgi:zinc transport system substrate-binding protein
MMLHSIFCRGLLILMALGLFCSCQKSETSPAARNSESSNPQKLIIAVSYPLEYLTQRIAGPDFEVRCPVPADQLASKWKPNREEIRMMQGAEMIVANGVGARFEKWLEMASIPASKVCSSATRGLSLSDFIEIDDVRFTHSHGNLGEHSHSTNCVYTWLHPAMSLKQSQHIADELSRRYPELAAGFAKRFSALSQDLKKLLTAFEGISKSKESEFSAVLTANPDLKFFSRACNWDDVHFMWFDPPDPATATADLEKYLAGTANRSLIKRNGKILILSTYPFPAPLLSAMESYKVTVVVIDKLDRRPKLGDYLSVMNDNIAKLQE